MRAGLSLARPGVEPRVRHLHHLPRAHRLAVGRNEQLPDSFLFPALTRREPAAQQTGRVNRPPHWLHELLARWELLCMK